MQSWGVQNEPPQHVPQWYADYFELEASLASGSKETSSPLYYLELELGA